MRAPTLRTTAALVVSLCAKDPALTPRIRRAFRDLVEHHPELGWFYGQLPRRQAQQLYSALTHADGWSKLEETMILELGAWLQSRPPLGDLKARCEGLLKRLP